MKRIVLGMMVLLCVMLVGCGSGTAKPEETEREVEKQEAAPEETEQEAAEQEVTKPEVTKLEETVSYYDTWKVWDYQSAAVSALSQEEIDGYKGYTLTYEPDAVFQNGRDMNIADPEYTATAYTEEMLVQDYRVNLGEWWNGVSEVSCISITAEEPFFGQHFFAVNDDVIWIYYEGVFFLARRADE